MSGTILIVEDDPSLAVTETIWLEREGYTVVHVTGGEEAVEIIRAGDYTISLILMDIELKAGIDGITTAKMILEEKDIPIIFISSHTEKSIVEKTEQITSYGYVVKDTMDTVLIASIKMAFKLYHAYSELKAKEDALIESDTHIRESQRVARIGSYEVDLMNNKFTSSEELDRISGIEKSTTKTRDFWYSIIHPDYREEVTNFINTSVLTDRKPLNLEYKIIRPTDNAEIWVWETGEVFYDETGKPVKIKGVIQDISIRKQSLEGLMFSENLYRVLLDDSSDPIFAIDEDATYLYVNKAFANGVKREQKDIIGKRIFDVFSKEEAEQRFFALSEVIKTGVPKVIEVKVDAHGTDHFYMTTIQPLNNKYANKGAVMCISKDITKRKIAEMRFAEKEKQYQDLFLKSPGALLLEDLEGNIIDLNPSFCKIFGYTREELVGKNVRIFVPSEEVEHVDFDIEKLKTDRVYEHTVKNLKKDGSYNWVELRESIVRMPDGNEGILTLANDITIKKTAEMQLEKYARELEAANSTKNKFFSVISHDLRGPFQAFLGLSQALCEDIDAFDKEKIIKISGTLYTSLKRQYDLLNDLLDWSRLQSDNFALTPQFLPVFEEINKVLEPLLLAASVKEIVIFNAADTGSKVYADSNMFRLVLRNLISNAIKFTKANGIITISSSELNDQTEIIVSDNGVGIDEVNLRKLFCIDQRFSTEGTSKENGTGLGLILCKEIIDKHNGSIIVKSTKDKGTRFIITLPSVKV